MLPGCSCPGNRKQMEVAWQVSWHRWDSHWEHSVRERVRGRAGLSGPASVASRKRIKSYCSFADEGHRGKKQCESHGSLCSSLGWVSFKRNNPRWLNEKLAKRPIKWRIFKVSAFAFLTLSKQIIACCGEILFFRSSPRIKPWLNVISFLNSSFV